LHQNKVKQKGQISKLKFTLFVYYSNYFYFALIARVAKSNKPFFIAVKTSKAL